MSQKKFLDKIGLQNFLNRIKALIPTKTSELQNDSGFITSEGTYDSALSLESEKAVQNKVVTAAINGKQETLSTAQTNAVDSGITSTKVQGYDSHISDTDIHVTQADKTSWDSKASGTHTHLASEVSGLSTVATSGSYNDLSNKPSIPSKTSDLTNDSGFLTSHNPVDSALSSTSTNAVQNKVINTELGKKANTTDLATVATSGSYNDLSNKPTIPTVYNKTLTIQQNGTTVKTFTANSNADVTANIVVPTKTSDLTNDSGYLTAHQSLADYSTKADTIKDLSISGKVITYTKGDDTTGTLTTQDTVYTHPTSAGNKHIPSGGSANQYLKYSASGTAQWATIKTSELNNDSGFLTSHNPVDSALSTTSENAVQNKVVKAELDNKANSADLSTVATTGSYTDLNNIPSNFTPASHTHGSITNDGKLGTASRALITDGNKKIAVSSVTSTELGYLSGVTSAVQDQLDGKAASTHSHTASEVSGLATVATSGSYNDLANKPTIPTVNNATLTIQKNGATVKTFTANASANVTANIAVPTKVSELTNDSGFLTSHNPVDSALSDTSTNAVQNKVVKGALDGKSDTGHTHTASEVSGLSTVATSGSYNDLTNKPTIPTVNNATLTIQKNGTTVKTFTANASSNVTANITVPTKVSELTNDSGYLTSASNLDSSKLTGTIDIARLPKGALERLVTVADQTARFALTTSDVQLGDTVKQLDTGVMYIVTDESKLSSADGYTEYTAGSATAVPWSGVTGKPSSYTPASHSHGNIANGGTLGTASRALITDGNKKITTSSVTSTELGYVSGVTSAIQTQLDGKAASSHTHTASEVSGLSTVATSGSYNDLSNKPTIPTVNNATLTIQKNGSTVKTFTANASSNVTANITVPTKTSDLTNDSHQTITVGTDTTSTASPAHSGTFTCIDSVTRDSNGHVTAVNTKTVTLPADNNTDTLVTQNVSTANENHPVLLTVTKDATANQGAKTSIFASGVKVNPSTNTVTATTFSGALSGNASTATQFSANKAVTLTGDVTGTASSKAGWSVATTLADSGVTAGTYGPSADVTGNNNATISVPEITVDSKGRVTSVANRTLTCKNNTYNVYNKTLTIQKNGTNVATFTSNSNTDVTANITVPTKTSELTNDSGFLTSHQSLSNYVTLDGTQTISGAKTLSANLTIAKSGPQCFFKDTRGVKGTAPSSNIWNQFFYVRDNNNVAYGGLEHGFKTTKENRMNLIVYPGTTDNTSANAQISVGFDSNGNAFTYAPTPDASSNTTQMATTAWVRTYAETTKKFLTSHQSLANYSTLANTIKSLSISGRTITYTKGDDTTGTLTTQDNNTWTAMVGATSSANGSVGYVNAVPPKDGYNTKYLRADGTWAVPPDHTYTVNNATLTIQKNGTNVATFTSNASANATANITVPTKTSELTNDSGFLTSHQSLSNYVTLNSAQTISATKTWTKSQSFKNTAITNHKENPSADTEIWACQFWSNDNKYWGGLGHKYLTTGFSEVQLCMSNWTTSGSQGYWHIDFGAAKDFSSVYFRPSGNNSIYLGTSDKKWANVYATTFTGNLTGNVTGNCSGSSGSCTGNAATATQLTKKSITTANYEMNKSDFTNLGYYAVSTFKSGTTSAPAGNNGDYHLISLNNGGNNFNQFLCMTPRRDSLFYGHFWDGTWQGWREVATVDTDQTISGNKTFTGTLTGTLTGNCSGSSGSCTGNAATATQFSANTTVALTGDATGTSTGSKKGWSVPVTLANSGVTAGTYGPSADVTGNNNATISVPQITVDAKGRVTSVTNRTLTCKNNTYTVNNATLTIQKNGTNVATFTSNASSNVTANITVPTKTSELTNNSGFLTSHQDLSLYPYKLSSSSNGGTWTYLNLADSDHIATGFNNVTDTGDYHVRTTADVPGTPVASTSDGILIVLNTGSAANISSNRRCQQFFWTNGTTPRLFKRLGSYASSTWTWNNWVEIATTASDISGKAAKATGNANGKELTNSIIKGLSISGKTITYTQIDGSTGTLTTQDTVYTHPTSAGNKHVPSGGSSGQFLGWASDGTAKWVNNPNTNTDTLMTQNVSTTNATYPVLLVATADATANQGAKTGIFAKSVKVNPSTNVISASGFSGPLTGNVTGNCSGTSANVTGTVAIANGGTGATSRLNAVKALTNENVGTGTNYFLTITTNWGKAGYCSVADAKTVLGLGSAAYTASTAYAAASHTHTKSQITDFPTKVSAFTNDSGYLTSHQSLANYVTLNGTQTISGVKSISTDLKFVLSGTRGTAPSATTHRRPVDMVDSAGNRVFLLTTAYNTNMSSMTELMAYNTTTASGNSIGSIGIGCDSSGNCYTKAPTPSDGDNSTKIATTAWVNSRGCLFSNTSTRTTTGTWSITGRANALMLLQVTATDITATNEAFRISVSSGGTLLHLNETDSSTSYLVNIGPNTAVAVNNRYFLIARTSTTTKISITGRTDSVTLSLTAYQ